MNDWIFQKSLFSNHPLHRIEFLMDFNWIRCISDLLGLPSLKWLCELNNHMDSIGYPDVRLSFYTPNYFLLGTFGVSCLVSRLEFWFPVIGEARRLYFVLLGAEFFPHEIKKKTNGHPSPLRLRACHFFKWMEFCWFNENKLFNIE